MEERKGEYMYSELYTYPKDTEGAIIHSKSIPNIYPLKNIAVYRHEFAYAQEITEKLLDLQERKDWNYTHVRSIRGDGDCYFRAVAYAYFEKLVIIGHHAIQQFKHLITMDEGYYTLKNCKDEYSISVLHGHLEELARYIQKPTNNKSSHLQFLMGLFLTTVFDKAVICLFRQILDNFMELNEELDLNGITIANSMIAENLSVNEFRQQVILKEKEEAVGVLLYVLPIVLRIQINIIYVDFKNPKTKNSLQHFPSSAPNLTIKYPDALNLHEETINIILKPGHYDILYRKLQLFDHDHLLLLYDLRKYDYFAQSEYCNEFFTKGGIFELECKHYYNQDISEFTGYSEHNEPKKGRYYCLICKQLNPIIINPLDKEEEMKSQADVFITPCCQKPIIEEQLKECLRDSIGRVRSFLCAHCTKCTAFKKEWPDIQYNFCVCCTGITHEESVLACEHRICKKCAKSSSENVKINGSPTIWCSIHWKRVNLR